ncbi:MAG: hypothetical protein K8R63_12875 [Bacteroidales bacterium]|nr:hypothetical protein [Bacteroidales bacterium]
MKPKLIILLVFLFAITSCKKENNEDVSAGNNDQPIEYSFTGKAQKGPYVVGSNILVQELDDELHQTGSTFTTTIASNDGSFSINNINLNSNLVMFTADGFYFSEVIGELSSAKLSLKSISDINTRETVNINVLSHIVRQRIEKLVDEGMTYLNAYDQAKMEILSFLGAPELADRDFEDYDISLDNDYNAVLLSFSVILPSDVAQCTEMMAHLSNDLKDNGDINNQALIDTLLYNISLLNISEVRDNVESRYAELGISFSIPEFEHYINVFQIKHDPNLITEFHYPDTASPFPITAPNSLLPNILHLPDTFFTTDNGMEKPYSLAAIIPYNSTLTIRFIKTYGGSSYGGDEGWEFINDYPNGFTLVAEKQNQLISALVYLEESGSAIIEYYENDTIPIHVKTIRWE